MNIYQKRSGWVISPTASTKKVRRPFDFRTNTEVICKLPEDMTIGTDPELMLWDTELGRMASAIRVLGNDKNTPIDLGDGIYCYADNVMIEARVPPQTTISGLATVLGHAMQRMQDKVGKRYRLVATAAHEFDPAELSDPKAVEIGCTENFDAYTKGSRAPGQFTSGLRTGSFHIHIGCKEAAASAEARRTTVKLIDLFLGCASVVFDTDPSATLRRTLYGKAGEYRPTKYGVEYRVLGNYALRSPELVILAGRLAILGASYIRGGCDYAKDIVAGCGTPEQIAAAINTNDASLASKLLGGAMPFSDIHREIVEPRAPDLYRDWKIAV